MKREIVTCMLITGSLIGSYVLGHRNGFNHGYKSACDKMAFIEKTKKDLKKLNRNKSSKNKESK